MAIFKIERDSKFGKGTLYESRVTLFMPGSGAEKHLYRFVQLTDLHLSCYRPEDSEEMVELAKSRAEFWRIQAGFFIRRPDGSEDSLVASDSIELVADRIRELSPDMVFFTGDTTDFSSVSNFLRAGDFLRSLGTEYIMVPGNHDSIGEDADEELVRAYEYAVGNLEDFCVRTCGGIDIVSASDGFVRVTAEQVEKLEACLAKGRPTIVLLHAPIFTQSADLPVRRMWSYGWMVGEEGQPEENIRFRQVLNEHRDHILAVFAGHVHTASGGGEGKKNFEGFSPEEVLQYTAAPAFTGFLRVIDVYGD